MELYEDIFMKCLSLQSADVAQDHIWNWTNFCGKQIQDKKAYQYKGPKYDQKWTLVSYIGTLQVFL